jgi:hypothetical protein
MFDVKIDEFAQDIEKLLPLLEDRESEGGINLKGDPVTRFLSKRCMLGIGNREIQRLNRGRIFGMVREAMLRLGDIYTRNGCIDEQRDVFWLTLEEIRSLAERNCDMRDAVVAIVKDYNRYVAGKPYNEETRLELYDFFRTQLSKFVRTQGIFYSYVEEN